MARIFSRHYSYRFPLLFFAHPGMYFLLLMSGQESYNSFNLFLSNFKEFLMLRSQPQVITDALHLSPCWHSIHILLSIFLKELQLLVLLDHEKDSRKDL